MAPTDKKIKHKTFEGKDGNQNRSKTIRSGVKMKRKWVPENKQFEGSVKEGQGFAFKRKQKAKHEYNRLLRKEKKKNTVTPKMYKEEYPEHLKHLYLAEEEKLKNEAWTNRVNRSKLRMKNTEEELHEKDAALLTDLPSENPGPESASDNLKQTAESDEKREQMSIPMSNRMRKKLLKKTSAQRTKEEFERITEKRRAKKEEYLKNKQQREEAQQRYKQKKIETYQMLCKKTKKGQPNFNLQMEYLLQKIERTEK